MIVVTLNKCPPALRGDLTKWLMEINTGVYVGDVNAKVRDALWHRICESIKTGQATMVYPAKNEQRMEFRVHNSSRIIEDHDGLKLVKIPERTGTLDQEDEEKLQRGFSNAHRNFNARRRNKRRMNLENMICLDLETTGLDSKKDNIIEIGMLKMRGDEREEYDFLIKGDITIPDNIKRLTGLPEDLLEKDGISLEEAMEYVIEYTEGRTVLLYNAGFDMAFLSEATEKRMRMSKVIDVMELAKARIVGLKNYRLETVANYFGIDLEGQHRALKDCDILWKVFLKLNEM